MPPANSSSVVQIGAAQKIPKGKTYAPPEKWLRDKRWPFSEASLSEYCSGYVWEMLLAVTDSPEAVLNAKFIINDWDGLVDVTTTRINWLCELSRAIAKLTKEAPFKVKLSQILSLKFGEPFLTAMTETGKQVKILNYIHFSSVFAYGSGIEFDDRIGCFYRYNSSAGVWRAISEERMRRHLIDFIIPFMQKKPRTYPGSSAFCKEIITHARPTSIHEDCKVEHHQFLCVQNGVVVINYDPRRAIIYSTEHSPAYKLRNAIPVEYDEKNKGCTKFREFLENIMSEDDIDLLQYWCGFVLLGKNPFHKILIISGEAKAGKSTLINIIENIIGQENIATLVTERLEDRFELSEFFEKTLLIAKDVGKDFLSKKSAHMLKSLSGDSGIKAEVKHLQARVLLGGPFNIAMTCNNELLVNLQGDDDAWRRRLWIIPIKIHKKFNAIPDFDKVLLKNEGPGILNWMLAGVRRVLSDIRAKKQFTSTAEQKAVVDNLLAKSDGLDLFVKTCLRPSPGNKLPTFDIYDAYSSDCAKEQKDPMNEAVFYRRIGKFITRIHDGSGPVTIQGVKDGKALKCYKDVDLVTVLPPPPSLTPPPIPATPPSPQNTTPVPATTNTPMEKVKSDEVPLSASS